MFKFFINLVDLCFILSWISFVVNDNDVFEFDHTLYYKIPSYYGSRAAGYNNNNNLNKFQEYFSKNAIL